jgi:hypothetical protein
MLPFSSRSRTPLSQSIKAAARQKLRLARVQPRLLLLAMLIAIGGTSWWAIAQKAKPSTSQRAASSGALSSMSRLSNKPLSLADLPNLMRQYGEQRKVAQGATATASGASGAESRTASAVTTRAFPLTEVDLTPGNISDEREPAVRPSGDFIAFVSNGVDNVNNTTGATGADGRLDPNAKGTHYHIWIMRRNGTGQRQVTGFGADTARSQRHPSWSPDGNRLVYVDGTGTTAQLYFVNPFATDAATAKPPIQQITFFTGEKRSPAWGPSGAIAFATNVVAAQNGTTTPTPGNNFDIFTIDSGGSLVTLRRLTGGTNDPVGDRTNDFNPSFSLINVGVLFFSSNRDRNGVLPVGRRIWAMGATSGASKRQITDPTASPFGAVTDEDDYPSSSLTQTFTDYGQSSQFAERLAFESNRRTDASDTTRDLNVWSLRINSPSLAPPPTPPAAALTVASFSGNRIRDYNDTTGAFRRDFTAGILANPEDVIYGPDFTGDGYPDLLVANRNRNIFGTIEIFNGVSGQFVRSLVRGTATNGLDEPTGMDIGPDGNLYVANGTNGNISRVILPGGLLLPFATGGGIAAIEGIAFGPDSSGDGFADLYAASPFDDRIAVFNGLSGAFIRDFVAAGVGGLDFPTGLTFGPDRNGDSINELYVASGGINDAIKVYNGQTGAYINDLVSNAVDATLNGPERLTFGPDTNADGVQELYVTIFGGFGGLRVNRYSGRNGALLPAAGQTGSAFVVDALVNGASGLTFNPVADGSYVIPTANAAPVETGTVPAALESNLLSSPARVTSARYQGAAEDKSADREPNFARSNATSTTVAQIVFASQRRTASAPSTNPAAPQPAVVNPGGGPQFTATTPPRPTTFTHDIWATASQDFTPPILIPVAVGGQLYPALAPGVQAPFTAPRTAEEGLTPGSKVTIAFVIQDMETGLQSASVVFKDADRPTFFTGIEDVDYPGGVVFQVETAVEGQPEIVTSVNNTTGRALTLRIYDNGPVSAGGNERQQNAIAGDGTYYTEASFNTVDDSGAPLTGDYYIDLSVADNAGNTFVYDNVYGFSTKGFAKNNKVLFVSDYTVGQAFPILLSGFAPRSGIQAEPCESYFLNNPGGTHRFPAPANPAQDLTIPFSGVADTTTLGSLTVDPVTGESDYADVWRILSRGPVTRETLSLYSPQITEQLLPGADPNRDGIPGPYINADGTPITRQTAVASSCVVWGAPYTGDVFAAPGTLYDGATQRDLTAFLETGGRLFVSGQDIAFALTNNGTVNNSFLQNELKANYGGESLSRTIDGTGDPLIVNGNATGGGEPPDTLNVSGVVGASYGDAAQNQAGMDILTPVGATAGETVTALYNYGSGGLAGQRVEKQRANGLESRLVFFGFGFEGVHRSYRIVPDRCLNYRSKIFYNMTRIYFYTGGISGRVISAATNQPIPNFYIEVVVGGTQTFIARTDENGEYEILGVPYGGYTVRPLQYNDNGVIRSGNGSFFPGPAQGAFVVGGQITRNVNFRVQPAPPGSISGRAINNKGTVDVSDDASPAVTPAVGVPVLIRSIRSLPSSASFPQGGIFAAITVTDGAGRFTLRNVPSNEVYELIFNPRPGFTNATDPTKRGDIPPNSGVVYPNPDPTAPPQPNLSYGRRVIPVDPTYGVDFVHPQIRTDVDPTGATRPGFLIPIGENLDIGDVPIPPGTGPGGGGTPVPTDDFLVGSVYMISIPWMDTSALTATTTPVNAFTLPPTDPVTREANYRLSRFDPLTQKYVALGNNSILQRGEGYFLRPLAKPVSFRRPGATPARVPLPTTVNRFTVTLRRSSSLAATDPNNGFNLIGFPFNPATYKSVNWTVSSVYVPSTGARYSSVTAAAAAGVMSSTIFTLTDTSGTTYTTGSKLVPLKGYFAKTFVDNVQVTMVASTNP